MVSAAPHAAYSLVDHHGRRVTQADFAGRFQLVYFGFTHCRSVCPRSLAKLSSAVSMLGGDADRVVALYVTVDPARDTPEVMAAYLSAYPAFVGLTGSDAEIAAAKTAFRVFSARRELADRDAGYDVPHTAHAYLMGPDGGYRDHFGEGVADADIAERIRAALSKDASND